jgi:hypothetical protein
VTGPKLTASGTCENRVSAPAVTRRRLGFTAASVLVAASIPIMAASAAPLTLMVEASGALPGFRSADLPRYLALQMGEARFPDWRFEPASGDTPAPNRVEWRFRLNPYAGGGVRSMVRAPMIERNFAVHRPIRIETRLYLNGEYQTLVSGQATIQAGPDDRELAAAVTSLTQGLLGASGAYRGIDPGMHRGHL